VAIIGGIGIEASLFKRLMARVDWRYEFLLQYPSVGLAWQF
jgi:hypothetical protein